MQLCKLQPAAAAGMGNSVSRAVKCGHTVVIVAGAVGLGGDRQTHTCNDSGTYNHAYGRMVAVGRPMDAADWKWRWLRRQRLTG